MIKKNSTPIETAIQITLIALLSLLCFKIAEPFLAPIIWAGIIAIGIYPIYLLLKNKTGLSAGWSATLISFAMIVTLILPTVLISSSLIDNAQSFSNALNEDTLGISLPPKSIAKIPLVGEKISELWTTASKDPKEIFGEHKSEFKVAAKWFLSLAAGMSLNILLFIFSIIIAGVFLTSAEGVKKAFIIILNRLTGEQGESLTKLSLATVNSVVTGILGIALIQSLLAGVGFVVVGIPAAGVLAFICLIMAIIQVDILLLLIPLSIYVFSDADTSTTVAITFLVWNIAVGLLNNVLKPILLAKGVDAPMAIIFVGAIGGMIFTGIIGLFLGAVLMVLGYTLFIAWLKIEADEDAQELANEQLGK
jgi:predicted PurR-regulated permease PerM